MHVIVWLLLFQGFCLYIRIKIVINKLVGKDFYVALVFPFFPLMLLESTYELRYVKEPLLSGGHYFRKILEASQICRYFRRAATFGILWYQ